MRNPFGWSWGPFSTSLGTIPLAALFGPSDVGFWPDGFNPASGRLFQTSVGVTPATSFDQPVGKIIRGAGSVDLVQSVSGSRPTMARWPRGGRRNLYRNTPFAGAAVGPPSVPPASWGTIFTGEILEAGDTLLRVKTNNTRMGFYQEVTNNQGLSYVLSCAGFNFAPIDVRQLVNWTGGYTLTNSVSFHLNGLPIAVAYIVPEGAFALTATIAGADNVGGRANVGRGVSNVSSGEVAIYECQVELGDSPTPYQRVTTANDVTESGIPDLWHLYNDGGDSLQTDGPVPAGTYGYAYVDPYGEITFDTRVSDGINPVTVADDPGRYLDLILRKGDFSAGEKDNITDYWERLYK